MRKMAPLPQLFLILVLFTSGCGSARLIEMSETPAQLRYSVLQTFKEYDTAALSFAKDPNTPANIAYAIRNVRNVARAALDIMDEAYIQLQLAEENLNLNPSEENNQRVLTQAEVFRDRFDAAKEKVDRFVATFKKF